MERITVVADHSEAELAEHGDLVHRDLGEIDDQRRLGDAGLPPRRTMRSAIDWFATTAKRSAGQIAPERCDDQPPPPGIKTSGRRPLPMNDDQRAIAWLRTASGGRNDGASPGVSTGRLLATAARRQFASTGCIPLMAGTRSVAAQPPVPAPMRRCGTPAK